MSSWGTSSQARCSEMSDLYSSEMSDLYSSHGTNLCCSHWFSLNRKQGPSSCCHPLLSVC